MSSQSPEIQLQQRTSPVALKVAVSALAVTSVALAALYYQATRDIETQKATVAGLQVELAKEVARAAELKSDLNTAHTDAQTLAAKSAQLSSEVESKEQALAAEKSKAESAQAALDQEKARLPPVPVRIEMRRSAVGRGLVAMFTNTSARQLSVLMATRNPTTEAEKEKSFQVAPGRKVEIGYLEGVQFASGDQIRLRSAGFEELHYTVQ
jgi:septal ring factor EnvC (AmiA/AmiB activator)